MIKTKQTILHDPANGKHGNCLSAVIASLLHIDIETVPVFCTPGTWVKDLNSWLRQFGLAYCMIEDFDLQIEAYGIEGLWHEISGNTSRSNDVAHACVAKDGALKFDPHPDNSGLTKITCHGFFIALEPWRCKRKSGEQIVAEIFKLQDYHFDNEGVPIEEIQMPHDDYSALERHLESQASYKPESTHIAPGTMILNGTIIKDEDFRHVIKA